MADKIKDRLKAFWQNITGRKDDDQDHEGMDREKVIVFAISLFLAFCLWLIVNLNRDFSLEIDVPVQLGNITTELALAEELPEKVTASVSGNGWELITLYKNPPSIYVDVSGKEINLFEQVRRQISTNADVSVQTVEPLYLQIQLEPKEAKKVPVQANMDVSFAGQYAFLDEPVLTPDSVTIRGAASHIAEIDAWPTDTLVAHKIKENLSGELNLQVPTSLITLSQTNIDYEGNVAQFTEGEVMIPVQTRNFPVGNMVTFSPSSVQVKYRVPLNEYAKFSDGKTFVAFVEYTQMQNDSTGFVSPQIEKISEKAHLKIRSIRPREVAYFTIIGN